jgi:hypothetical protein
VSIQPGGVDLRQKSCQNRCVAAYVHAKPEADRERIALKRAKSLLEQDLIRATWEIYRRAKHLGPRPLTIQKLAEKAGGNFRSFNNWKQGHEVPKLLNLQKFAEIVAVNIRVIVQDAGSEDLHLGATEMMSEDAIDLANEIERLPDEDRAAVRAFIAGMRAKSRPSERVEDPVGARHDPRK